VLDRHEEATPGFRRSKGARAFFVSLRGRSRVIGFAQVLVDLVLHRTRLEHRATPSHDGTLAWLLGVSRRTAQRWRLAAIAGGMLLEGSHGLEPTAAALALPETGIPVPVTLLRRRGLTIGTKLLWGIIRRENLRAAALSRGESGRGKASASPWRASDRERGRRAGLSRRTIARAAERLQRAGWARFAKEVRRTNRGLPLELRVGAALVRPRAVRRVVVSVPKSAHPHGPTDEASLTSASPDVRALVVRGVTALDARRPAAPPASPPSADDLQRVLAPWRRHGGADVRALWEVLGVSGVHRGPTYRGRRRALALALSQAGVGAGQLAEFVISAAARGARNLGAFLAVALQRIVGR